MRVLVLGECSLDVFVSRSKLRLYPGGAFTVARSVACQLDQVDFLSFSRPDEATRLLANQICPSLSFGVYPRTSSLGPSMRRTFRVGGGPVERFDLPAEGTEALDLEAFLSVAGSPSEVVILLASFGRHGLDLSSLRESGYRVFVSSKRLIDARLGSDLFLTSLDDLGWGCLGEASRGEVARRVASESARRWNIPVSCSAGELGAYMALPGGERVLRSPAPMVQGYICTVGCGDWLAGTAVAQILKGSSLPESLEAGVRAAAGCCRYFAPGMLSPLAPTFDSTEPEDIRGCPQVDHR